MSANLIFCLVFLLGLFEILYSSSISKLFNVNFASHFFIKLLVQILPHLKISPGTANKSFPKSSHSFAVIKLPDFSLASIINIHSDNPATTSFLTGKLYGFQTSQIGKMEMVAHPFSAISQNNFSFQTG